MVKNTLRCLSRAATGLLIFLFLAVPSALTEEIAGVAGISLQTAPNAIAVSWNAPPPVNSDHYMVSYAKQSILQNNGRFDDQASTVSDETSLLLLDLQNRGFADGDMIFVTVTAVDAAGAMTPVGEEQSTRVQIADAVIGNTHAAPTLSLGLEHALAESLTSVILHFSGDVRLPAESPAGHFAITEDVTTKPIGIVKAIASGQDITLTTLPMTARSRYTVAVSDAIMSADGSPIDPAKRTATFIGRGSGESTSGIEESSSSEASSESSSIPSSSSSIPVIELPPAPDTTAPEPPRMLTLAKELQKDGKYTVHASWQESVNTEGDVSSYNLYESADRGVTFSSPTALQATVTSTTIANVPPGTLTVKVTALDEVPNESSGIVETIFLPETGPALLLGMSVAGALFSAARRRRRMR